MESNKSFGSTKVINLCNSKIGYSGNIGLRTSHIIQKLKLQGNINSYSISRASFIKGKKTYTYGILKNVPSLLNYIRVNFYNSFDHKYFDIVLFEVFVLIYLRLIRLKKGDIIHLWEMSPRIIKYLKIKGCKIILDVPIAPHKYRNEIKDELLTKFSEEQNKRIIKNEYYCFKNVDGIIVPSIFVQSVLLTYGINEEKVEVVPFGVDVDSEKKTFKIKKGIDYCFAGVLNNRKGIQYLLKAWESGNFIEDRLHLCGKLTPGIKKQIHSMKNKFNIVLPGYIDTYKYFKNCDVYVFPSLMEGSSKSIYEAMNRSLPVICTHESGSIINDAEEGFLIEKMNTQDILRKMLLFKNEKNLIESMGAKSKTRVLKFTWAFYAENIINCYKKIQ